MNTVNINERYPNHMDKVLLKSSHIARRSKKYYNLPIECPFYIIKPPNLFNLCKSLEFNRNIQLPLWNPYIRIAIDEFFLFFIT